MPSNGIFLFGGIGEHRPAAVFRTKLSLALGLLRAADPSVIVLSGLVAHYVRIGTLVPSESYGVVIVLGALLAANFLALGGCYRVVPETLAPFNILRGLFIWLAVIGVLLAGLFLAKVSVTYSRGFIRAYPLNAHTHKM